MIKHKSKQMIKHKSIKDEVLYELEATNQMEYGITLQRKNKDLFRVLKFARTSPDLSSRQTLSSLQMIYKDFSLKSRTQIDWWKKDFNFLIENIDLFNEFVERAGIDVETDRIKPKEKYDPEDERTLKLKLERETTQAKLMIVKLNNPDISDTEAKEKVGYNARRQLDKVNEAMLGIPIVEGIENLYDINGKILAKWKEKILKAIEELNPNNFSELKALSDIIDTAFKQNRLIEWKSTENIAIWLKDIYDTIIEKNNALNDYEDTD